MRPTGGLQDLPADSVALLPIENAASLLSDCLMPPGCPNVTGVLLQFGLPSSFSSAPHSPQSDLALYRRDREYSWNPMGNSLERQKFPFPVLLLDNFTTQNALQRVEYNERSESGAITVASIHLSMDASDTSNASSCISTKKCLPLGGYSILASYPPKKENDGDDLPLIFVLAQVDTSSFLHGREEAADAPLSGLVSVMTAAFLLGNTSAVNNSSELRDFSKRVVFVALVGEPWGLMGSKRLLWEMTNNSTAVGGFKVDRIESIIEVGQIGRASEIDGVVQLYAHTPQKNSSSSSPLVETLQRVASHSSVASVRNTSDRTPGLPPCSSNAFLRSNPGANVVVLTEFNEVFHNPYYHSQYDVAGSVSNQSIAATAGVLAQTLHELMAHTQNGSSPPLEIDYEVALNMTEELVSCLIMNDPGLKCSLGSQFFTPVGGAAPSHYVGVMRSPTPGPQDPDASIKKDVERFIWNYFALATSGALASIVDGGASTAAPAEVEETCTPYDLSQCKPDQLCAGVTGEAKGFCVSAHVLYAPSYSTSLECVNCSLHHVDWRVTEGASVWEEEHGWPMDPMWVESNWPLGIPSVTLFLKEDDDVNTVVLGVGIAVVIGSVIVALALTGAYRKRLKED